MNELQHFPWHIFIPLLVIQVILVVIALVDLSRAEETRGPKWMWVPIILFISLIGAITYFLVGRRQY